MSAGPVTAGGELRLLFFRSGGERFALDVGFVREVLPPPPVTPVPFVPPAVAGIVNHRGQVFTAIRFDRLAGLGEEGSPGALVLLRLPEMSVGLLVGAVDGIASAPGSFGAGGAATGVPFLRLVREEGRVLHAVDAEGLIDTIYQMPEAPRAAAR